jgi:hypothetical protein
MSQISIIDGFLSCVDMSLKKKKKGKSYGNFCKSPHVAKSKFYGWLWFQYVVILDDIYQF